jgi:hypothetical protein
MADERGDGGDDHVLHTHYDGVTNDLLTAGLGRSGLGGATAPGFVDPLHPTAEELRRSAIFNNYRALVDPTPGGGYGTLYGPNVAADGTVTSSEGLIAGDEYLAFAKGDGHSNVTMMVQVPTVSTRRIAASSRRPRPVRAASTAPSRQLVNGASSTAVRSPIRTRGRGPGRMISRTTP